ncbi:MAG: ferrous iron transport protein A [Burkholderiales bacterium]|nr:ferrous iron transport protein A [Burkholderiales bacterium]
MSLPLDQLPLDARAVIVDLSAAHQPPTQWLHQLKDLGFLPGEPVQVLHRTAPGGDPLVVRVGDSRFALRRAEARCVLVARAE